MLGPRPKREADMMTSLEGASHLLYQPIHVECQLHIVLTLHKYGLEPRRMCLVDADPMILFVSGAIQ